MAADAERAFPWWRPVRSKLRLEADNRAAPDTSGACPGPWPQMFQVISCALLSKACVDAREEREGEGAHEV